MSSPTSFSLRSLKCESILVSNSTATNAFLVSCEEFTRPRYSPGLPNVSFPGERKKARPSSNEARLTLPTEKAKVVEKEAVVLDSRLKNSMGAVVDHGAGAGGGHVGVAGEAEDAAPEVGVAEEGEVLEGGGGGEGVVEACVCRGCKIGTRQQGGEEDEGKGEQVEISWSHWVMGSGGRIELPDGYVIDGGDGE
ncbi:hypothetical protein NL676_035212 [Syzygium grande]|nr:hypothetical protein NL676_035212 [Syzygium grande]